MSHCLHPVSYNFTSVAMWQPRRHSSWQAGVTHSLRLKGKVVSPFFMLITQSWGKYSVKGRKNCRRGNKRKGWGVQEDGVLGRRILTIKVVLWRRKCGEEAATKQWNSDRTKWGCIRKEEWNGGYLILQTSAWWANESTPIAQRV